MLTPEQHLDDLVRHIELVRGACLLLGKRLMAQGRCDFGRLLVARGFTHDASKFSGIEWDYLHAGPNVPAELIELAMRQHTRTNPHHPEYWGGFENMPEISVAEMVCDWYARSAEFGTGLRDWIRTTAIERYQIDTDGERFRWVQDFVNLLLEHSFHRSTTSLSSARDVTERSVRASEGEVRPES
jgi:hypothetical protein